MLHTWQQAYNTVNVSQTLQRKLSLELQNEANYICCYRSVHLRHSTCPFIPLDTKTFSEALAVVVTIAITRCACPQTMARLSWPG